MKSPAIKTLAIEVPTMKALICEGPDQGLVLQTVDIPRATSGSVVIKVLAVNVEHSARIHISGKGPFGFPQPFTPGGQVIGRISETGPDATTLLIGQLILVDSFIRGRDNPNVQLLWGLSDGYTPQSKRFMADNWRHAGFAEYTIAPLENVFPLNEKILCQDLGYSFAELVYLQLRFVTYGGFRGINLQAGERIIIAPATGSHSGAGVGVALAMGAQVVAVGRNIDALKTLQNQFPQIDVAQITGDMATDTTTLQSFGTIDAVLDISPAQAKNSTHLTSCFNALKPYGRISLMGVIDSNIAIPYIMLMGKNATIKGQYMYRREDVEGLIKLAEAGILKLGKAGKSEVVGSYKLEQVEEALGAAEQMKGVGKLVVFEP